MESLVRLPRLGLINKNMCDFQAATTYDKELQRCACSRITLQTLWGRIQKTILKWKYLPLG